MKKISAILLVFVVVTLISYFGYKSIKKHQVNKLAESAINELPVFSFYTLNEKQFTYHNVDKKQTLLIYFHPECEHCQYEAKQLLLNKEKFSDTQIIMISPASLIDIKHFNTTYELNKIEKLKMLWDKDRQFGSYFGVATFPTILIYNQQNKLQKKYKGEVKIETILKQLTIAETIIPEKLFMVHNNSNQSINLSNVQLFLFDLGL